MRDTQHATYALHASLTRLGFSNGDKVQYEALITLDAVLHLHVMTRMCQV